MVIDESVEPQWLGDEALLGAGGAEVPALGRYPAALGKLAGEQAPSAALLLGGADFGDEEAGRPGSELGYRFEGSWYLRCAEVLTGEEDFVTILSIGDDDSADVDPDPGS